MKTGGTSLLYNLRARFGAGEVYPDPVLDPDNYTAYTSVAYLTALSSDRHDTIRVYCGHFPYVASSLLPRRCCTITVLRDPVERTISYLKQCKDEARFRDAPLEQIYEDPVQFAFGIHNHQVNVFALEITDEPLHVRNLVDIDSSRLALAKQHLDDVDIVGLHEHYEEFVTTLCNRFGWPPMTLPRRRVSQLSINVPTSLRRRIARDNAADIEFYEYARERVLRESRRMGFD